MTTPLEERVTLLTHIEEIFTTMGFATNIIAPSAEVPFHSLIVRFEGIGEADYLDFQLSFLPNATNIAEAENPLILQTFIELYSSLNPAYLPELVKLTNKLNLVSPLGLFGVIDDTGVLYYKLNSFVDKRTPLPITLELIDKQGGLILHVLNLFVMALLEVGHGEKSAQEAFVGLGFA